MFAQINTQYISQTLYALFKSGIILYIGYLFASYGSKLLKSFLRAHKTTKDVAPFCYNLIYYVILTLAFIMALSEMGLDTSSLIAISGGMAIALGLGLQDQLSQLAAGLVILIKRPFHIGDFITIANETGIVDSIDFFQTTLKATNNNKIVLPNSLTMNSVVTNYTANGTRRIDFKVVIRHEDSVDNARTSLVALCKTIPTILKEPSPEVLCTDTKEHGNEITLRCWVISKDYFSTLCLIREKSKTALLEKECYIATPVIRIFQPGD